MEGRKQGACWGPGVWEPSDGSWGSRAPGSGAAPVSVQTDLSPSQDSPIIRQGPGEAGLALESRAPGSSSGPRETMSPKPQLPQSGNEALLDGSQRWPTGTDIFGRGDDFRWSGRNFEHLNDDVFIFTDTFYCIPTHSCDIGFYLKINSLLRKRCISVRNEAIMVPVGNVVKAVPA